MRSFQQAFAQLLEKLYEHLNISACFPILCSVLFSIYPHLKTQLIVKNGISTLMNNDTFITQSLFQI